MNPGPEVKFARKSSTVQVLPLPRSMSPPLPSMFLSSHAVSVRMYDADDHRVVSDLR